MDPSAEFVDLIQILGVATLAAVVATLLRQPIVVAFIFVGVIVGPAGLSLVPPDSAFVDIFGRVGIALLLFVVGLKLDPALIRTAGFVAVVSGLGQVIITTVLGFLITFAFGVDLLSAFYISLALTFSSTVIIVKVLSDRREIDSLHGRIALGILIVQDIVVILALTLLSGLEGAEGGEATLEQLGLSLLRGAALVAVMIIVARFLIPLIEPRMLSTPEVLVLGGISWAVLMAAGATWAGFSPEMGAFMAGVVLATKRPRQLVAARLTTVRDFLLLFFFVSLGVHLGFADLRDQILPALGLSLFVLVGNPLIVMGIAVAMGFRARTGLFAGMALAQISEFSFVLMALGLDLGHVDESSLALVTLVGLITFAASTYMITYSHQIYRFAQPVLNRIERRVAHREDEVFDEADEPVEVLVFGTGRLGTVILSRLQEMEVEAMGVDFDPVAVRRLQDLGFHMRFADVEAPEFLQGLPLSSARIAVSTIRSPEIEVGILEALREHNFRGPVLLTSQSTSTADRLEGLGATLVLLPFEAAGERASEMIEETLRDPTYLERARSSPPRPRRRRRAGRPVAGESPHPRIKYGAGSSPLPEGEGNRKS